MNPIGRLPSLTACACIQLSVCLLAAFATDSLWGKKVVFNSRPCLWQLQPDNVVPALEELTVCLLLRYIIETQWTGFIYKAPGAIGAELGLGGSRGQLSVWLFGNEKQFERELKVNEWHSVCLTWSGQARRVDIYINGTFQDGFQVNRNLPQRLAAQGTLTLGRSHYIDANGEVQQEHGSNLIGEIGLFRMWAKAWSAEELREQSCADGDVVSWDLRRWKPGCDPIPDSSLRCAWSSYKIKMWTSIAYFTNPENCSVSLEVVTRDWLKNVFPPNISVYDILLSSPSRACHVISSSADLLVQQPQGSGALTNSSCDKCFSCEVDVKVDPSAGVEEVQTHITTLLKIPFSNDAVSLRAEPQSISVLPVESFPEMREPPTTISTGTSPTHSLPSQPVNVSTTGEPSELNQTEAVAPDTFFRVNLSLSMTGNPESPKDVVEKWAKEALEVNNTMTVLNLIMKENAGRSMEERSDGTMIYGQQKQYSCSFHVQEHKKSNMDEIKSFITAALVAKYENGSISIQAMDVMIKHIVPENCLEDTTTTIYGIYIWPETFPQASQEMGCNEPRSERAFRLCKLDIETDASSWAKPDMTNCSPLVSISDLNNITVTPGNTAEVVDMIQDLVGVQLGNNAELSSSELNSVVDKLGEVVDISVQPDVGANIVNIISNILLSDTDVTPVANVVLNLTNKMGDNMDFQRESVSLTAPSMALSMVNVDPDGFSGLTFGVSSSSSLLNPATFVNQSFVNEPLEETVATISLSSALHSFFPSGETDTARVQFQFYGTHDLFQDPDTNNSTQGNWTLNSYIISASINNSNVRNLTDRVVVTLRHQNPKQPGDKVQCRFWDFQRNGGQGGWNSRGCETRSMSANQTSCLCDHLTHFAVLLDVSRTPLGDADSRVLTVISYVGCGVSSIFLGITLLTYLAFEKLRRDYPSKILINLSAALLGLSLLFLLDSWFSSLPHDGVCIATAATLHYFLLASFTWMGLEAVHMYFALVKVFNTYVPSYILKFCAAGWGIPLVIVSLVLAVDKDVYGSSVREEAAVALQPADSFCWLQSDIVFYVTVVAFILLVLSFNICVFIVVLVQIRRMKANKPSANGGSALHDLRAGASLTVLLGLTWSVGLFSFGPGRVVLMYLFTIFNTLQGFFVFLFHCLMKENVRKQWRLHLCCGRFRLSEYSDWSRSVTVGSRFKKQNLVNADSLASDTSAIRKVSDSSEGSASHSRHQGA